MLRHNPKERPSAKRILMHPWIQRFAPEDTPNKGSSAPDVKASASKPPQVPTRRSVDESVFVDPAAPRGERRSSDQRKDANPASRRESQERRDQGARHGFERNDSNATWTSKSNRTLRPARRAIDTYEPIATSPPHREYREEQQWPPSAAKASAIRAPASALPSASATQWPAPITQPRSVSPRTRGQGGGGPSVGMMVMQRGEHPPAQPMQHSRSKVKMDAGVMFGQHKPPHTSHHLAGTGIIATTPLVLSAHQQQQRGTRASPGRSGRADSFDEEDSGEVEDGWHAHDYKDTLIRAPAHASQRPWGAADPRATAEARAGMCRLLKQVRRHLVRERSSVARRAFLRWQAHVACAPNLW